MIKVSEIVSEIRAGELGDKELEQLTLEMTRKLVELRREKEMRDIVTGKGKLPWDR